MSGKLYGVELPEDLEESMSEIRGFVAQGIPVIIVDNLDELMEFEILPNVVMVERE